MKRKHKLSYFFKFLVRNFGGHKNISIFAVRIMGLTGFDSKLRWYVSMRSDGCILHNPFGQKINWQQQVCSRCLIEVQ